MHIALCAAKVAEVSAGGYFGERALLSRERRAATVVAAGSVKVGKIDAATFVRLAPRLKMQNSLSMRVARTRQLLLSQAALHGWLLHLQQQQYHRGSSHWHVWVPKGPEPSHGDDKDWTRTRFSRP